MNLRRTCSQNNFGLLTIIGSQLGKSPASAIYDLIDPSSAEGFITWASSDDDDTLAYYERFTSSPLVSLGRDVSPHPTVSIENYPGMKAAVSHLLEVHGCRKVLFLRGPEEHHYAKERFRAYQDALAQHRLPYDDNLVSPWGDWGYSFGKAMTEELMDSRNLRPGKDFDAVVGSNDRMAIGAIQALHDRGIRVPDDLPVVGFNDSQEARYYNPPLTSVLMPFDEQAEEAIYILQMRMQGKEVRGHQSLGTRLAIRQSCGCTDSTVLMAKAPYVPLSRSKNLSEALEELNIEIKSTAAESLGIRFEDNDKEWSNRLTTGLRLYFTEQDEYTFLKDLAVYAGISTRYKEDAFRWHNYISFLRRSLFSYFKDPASQNKAENLWGQARVVIGEVSLRSLLSRQVHNSVRQEIMQEIRSAFVQKLTLDQVFSVVSKKLPRFGIPTFFLSLYDFSSSEDQSKVSDYSILCAAVIEGKTQDLVSRNRRFLSKKLLPEGLFDFRGEKVNLVLMPLHYRSEQLGFILVDPGTIPDGQIIEVLQHEISSAIKGAKSGEILNKTIDELREKSEILEHLYKSNF